MSRDILAELARLAPDTVTGCQESAGARPMELAALCNAAAAMRQVQEWRPQGERRAAMTQWSKYLWRLLLPPVVLARCREDRAVRPTGLIELEQGLPQRWRELDLLPALDHPAGWLEPWVAALAAQSGLRPRVLWSNAGNALEALLQRLQTMESYCQPARECLQQWLETPRWNGARNPLYRPVTYVDGVRLRRVCCLRYRLPDLDYCSTCPLPASATAKASTSLSAKRSADSGPPKNQVS